MTTDIFEPDIDLDARPDVEVLPGEIGDAEYRAAAQKAVARLVIRLLRRDPEYLDILLNEALEAGFDPKATMEEQLAQAAYGSILQTARRPDGPLPGEHDEWPEPQDLEGWDPADIEAMGFHRPPPPSRRPTMWDQFEARKIAE